MIEDSIRINCLVNGSINGTGSWKFSMGPIRLVTFDVHWNSLAELGVIGDMLRTCDARSELALPVLDHFFK